MKNIMMKLWLMCGIMLVAAAPLSAETEVVNGIEWTYRIVKDKAEICKSGGPAIPTSTTGAITIPSKLGGKPVTSIGRSAFSNFENLTSVKIPAGVTQIGPHSFACCRGLTNVVIPVGVTRIGDSAFDHCRGLTSVVIPAGVTRIGNSAFEGCDKLTRISIPNSVTNIGKKAFSGCRGVKSYFVTDDNPNYKFTNGMLLTKDGISIIATIGELKSIKIPDGVKYIDDGIFSFRDDISSVELPNSITDIGKQAFYRCGKLTNITIPNSVVSIEDRAFEDCGRLENITIPNSVTNIGDYAFSGCRSLMSIMIPNSVISIGGAAFSRCSGLKSFAIADDNRKYKFANGLLLTKDGTALLWATGAFTRVKVPDGVEYISNIAFEGCDRLMSVTIPKSVRVFWGSTFSRCRELKSLEVAQDNARFKSVNGLILTKDGTELVEAAGGLKSVNIPDGVTTIGNSAFLQSRIECVTIPNSVTNIGFHAFDIGQIILPHDSNRSVSFTFNGNAPVADRWNTFGCHSDRMTAYVKRDSVGWGVDIPGKWNGINIKYVDDAHAKPAAPQNAAGALAKDTISVTVDAQDLSMFSGRVLSNLLPKEEKASVIDGKWKFAKAAKVKWAKPKRGDSRPDIYDERTGMGLVIDTTQGKTNLSGLTLTCETQTKYRDKLFKGSFKVYELQGAGAKTKLTEYTMNVSGRVVNGIGEGRAFCRKPYISWPVTIE